MRFKLTFETWKLSWLYPEPESNRHGFPQVFETSASTNSAIRALLFLISGMQNYSFVLDSQKNSATTLK